MVEILVNLEKNDWLCIIDDGSPGCDVYEELNGKNCELFFERKMNCKDATDWDKVFRLKYHKGYVKIMEEDKNRLYTSSRYLEVIKDHAEGLRRDYYNHLPLSVVLRAVIFRKYSSTPIPNDVVELYNSIYKADVEEFKRNEFKRKFDKANGNWWKFW